MSVKLEHFTNNPQLEGMYQIKSGVVYSTQAGVELTLTIAYPWATDHAEEKPSFPLVVFIPGSGWMTPDQGWQLPQMGELARRGFVVATVGHRNCVTDEAPLPAALMDVKCAIRYLRAHAAAFGIDAERVAVWGSSSGSHMAQLVGVTADDPRFETDEWAGFSDAVSAVVGCFGPSDFEAWCDYNEPGHDFDPIKGKLLVGTVEERRAMKSSLSAINYVNAERSDALPAFLLGVGTADPWIEVTQVTRMADALDAAGADVQAFVVDGGLHEASFWSQAVLDEIWAFLDSRLR